MQRPPTSMNTSFTSKYTAGQSAVSGASTWWIDSVDGSSPSNTGHSNRA